MNRTAAIVAAIIAGTASVQSIRTTADYRRELSSCRAEHPVCEHSWYTNVEHSARVSVHHRIPVGWDWTLATSHDNLITLCDPAKDRKHGCHYQCGHGGHGWSGANTNVMSNVCARIGG
ncbi:MAG: hypothetical protein WC712_09435 [Candidatus Brocadiia bacterium]